MEIVVDAMGGDHAPSEIVKGAQLAVRELGVAVTLVGPQALIERELAGASDGITVLDAASVIGMDEHPARAVRSKRDSSIVVGIERVKERGGAFVSAGNSGATMAAALLTLGRLPGVDRPALATVFPTRTGRVVLIDVGANADVRPDWLRQFAVMGSLYAEIVLGISRPRVGLLSNGEEETKGNQLVQEAFPLLKEAGLNFIGNVEGRDIPAGTADVIVTDGFTGNVVIKLAEGVSETLFAILRDELTASIVTKVAAGFLRPAFRRIAKKLDYAEYGGAPLLGVRGLAIVAHGRSDARAIKAAIRVAKNAIDQRLVEAIAAGLGTPSSSGDHP
ncbi:MAG: phosphate acyltransferase PlsX [Chloroflexota bacterium]|nr:phosphate acyltransferase PlsX [Dehalococcoidia bacterium]MDW8253754.1 phosphate acyltransferase PlsX [Chloroflexota bacterium]